jgi:lipopolysaccharide export system permease protein
MTIVSSSSLSIISRYLRREFLRFFFLCLILFLGISLLIDFFDRLDEFIKYAAPASTVLRYLVFKAPLFITQSAPAAALTGSLLSLGLLARHRELLALKTCGISPWQMARPLLLSAVVLSVAVLAWNEFVVPYSFHKSRYINTVEIKQKVFRGLFHERGFWYHGENVFYHIDRFDSHKNMLFGLTIYRLDQNFQVRSLVEISQAYWQEGQWHFDNVQEKSLSPEQHDLSSADYTEGNWLQETPEDFTLVDMEAEEFSFQQLRTHIANLQRKGLDTTEYQVDLQLKGAVPAATLVMTLLGIALAIPGAKQFTLPTALGFALGGGFGYWLILALTVSLGHSGVLSPLPATWSANCATLLLGVFLLLGID